MSIDLLLLCLVGAFAFVRFVLQPAVARNVEEISSTGDVARAAWAGTLAVLSNVLFWGAISVALVSLTGLIANSLGGTSVATIQTMRDWLGWIQERLEAISGDLALATTVVVAAGLLFWTYRRIAQAGREALESAYGAEVGRLLESAERGELEPLPPSEAMQAVAHRFAAVQAALDPERSEEGAGATSSAADDEERGRLAAEADELRRLWQMLDIQRRVAVSVDPAAVGIAAPRGVLGRIGTLFVSDGLVRTLTGASRVLAIALSLLLIPAMLSLAAPATQQRLGAARERLERVELKLNLAELGEDFEATLKNAALAELPLAEAEAPSEEAASDEAAVRVVARLFETSVLTSGLVERATDAPLTQTVQSLRRARVRDAILATTERALAGRASGQVEGFRHVATAEAEAAELIERSVRGGGPVTRAGELAERRLLQIANEHPAFAARLRRVAGNYARSFTTPATAQTLRGLMVAQVIGHVGDSMPIDGRLGKLAAGQLGSVTGDVATEIMESQLRRFVVEIGRAPSLDVAAAAVQSSRYSITTEAVSARLNQVAAAAPSQAAIDRALLHGPPSIERLPERHVNVPAAQSTIQRYAQAVHGGRPPAQVADALASFADYFPGSNGADARTARYQTLAQLGVVDDVRAPTAAPGRSSSTFQRARSYRGLRGFARIGGVLIGRLPDDEAATLPVEKLAFELAGRQLFVDLQLQGQETRRLGPYSTSIAQLALAYAADGRPTTVTMAKAQPLSDLRILLHPALVDTALGCRLTRLDQFADEFSGEVPELAAARQEATGAALDLMRLYEYAWAVRAERLLQPDSPAMADLPDGLAEAMKPAVESRLTSSEIADAVGRSLGLGGSLAPLAAKPAFFDQRLLKSFQECWAASAPEQFRRCIGTDAVANMTRYRNDKGLWLAPPADFDIWSGVRERAYNLDLELAFLAGDASEPASPLEFMVQIAFKSAPYFAEPSVPWYSDEMAAAAEGFVDDAPWELTTMAGILNRTIANALRSAPDGEHASIVADAREFVVLQRLFRLALDGQLGDAVELEDLSELATDTAMVGAPTMRTLRWLARTGALEADFYQSVSDTMAGGTLTPVGHQQAAACQGWLDALWQDGALALAEAPQDDWDRYCALVDVDQFAGRAQEVTLMRRLRAQLGVAADDRQLAAMQRGDNTCAIAR